MKTFSRLAVFISALVLAPGGFAQIPVTDVANLTNNIFLHSENLAKWIESISSLRTQIDQLNSQINIQSDIRRWAGNPEEAGSRLVLDSLGESDLTRAYGQTRENVLAAVNSLDSLTNTAGGSFRAISDLDLNGNPIARDPLLYRRFSVLDATRANADQVTTETKQREEELQTRVAEALEDLKAASTDADTQKAAVKLAALNGQLSQVESARKREVDAVILQKTASDARSEQERVAAAELAAKDDFLANERVAAYMATIKLRRR